MIRIPIDIDSISVLCLFATIDEVIVSFKNFSITYRVTVETMAVWWCSFASNGFNLSTRSFIHHSPNNSRLQCTNCIGYILSIPHHIMIGQLFAQLCMHGRMIFDRI
eukprot:642422_1